MNRVIASLVLFCCTHAYSQSGFVMNGVINNLEDGTKIYLKHNKDGKAEIVDSAISKNGKLIFKGRIEVEPEFYFVFIEKKKEYLRLILENASLKIKSDTAAWPNAEVKGLKVHEEYIAYKAATEKLDVNAKNKYALKYIELHPNSYYTPILISVAFSELREMDSAWQFLTDRVKESFYAKSIKNRIDLLCNLSEGSVAPDFISSTPEGGKLSLKELALKSKLTLIDFWASWCVPCRLETLNLRKTYVAFHHKGFNILSVSFDEKEKSWRDAIEKDSMNWYHVSDLKGRDAEVHKLYNINSIPQTYLLDAEGKIIAINLRGEELYKKVEEILGKE